jgi:hypothetical protein
VPNLELVPAIEVRTFWHGIGQFSQRFSMISASIVRELHVEMGHRIPRIFDCREIASNQ